MKSILNTKESSLEYYESLYCNFITIANCPRYLKGIWQIVAKKLSVQTLQICNLWRSLRSYHFLSLRWVHEHRWEWTVFWCPLGKCMRFPRPSPWSILLFVKDQSSSILRYLVKYLSKWYHSLHYDLQRSNDLIMTSDLSRSV